MNITLNSDQAAFVQHQIEVGQYIDVDDLISDAIALLADRHQRLAELRQKVAKTNPKAASRTFDSIRQRAKLLATFPNMGKPYNQLASNLRGSIVNEYIILYYPKEDGIEIARVVSGYHDLETLFD